MTSEPPVLISAGVARVSLELQADSGYSLSSQVSRFKDLETKFGIKIPDEFVISDDGYSGADFSRPSIKKVLDLAAAGRIQCVTYPHVDRFSRNLEGGLNMIRRFREAGLEVLLGNLGFISDERSLKTQLAIGLLFSELQRDDLSAKCLDGVLEKLRRHFAHGGHAPYGYRFVTKAELAMAAVGRGEERPKRPGNLIVVVPTDAKVVILIYECSDSGMSYPAICRELVSRGIPPPGGPVRGHWNPETISRILENPVYAEGRWYYRKNRNVAPLNPRKTTERHRVKSSRKPRPQEDWMGIPVTAILDPALFARVRSRLDAKIIINEDGQRKSTMGGRVSDRYLLSRLGKCATCNAALVGSHKGERTWYSCSRRDRVNGDYLCSSHQRVRGPLLEQTVLDALREELGNRDRLNHLVSEHQAELMRGVDASEIDSLKTQQNRLLSKILEASTKEIKEDDSQLKAHYARIVQELKSERSLVSKCIEILTGKTQTINVNTAEIAELITLALQTKVWSEQYAILHDWIDGVRYALGGVEIIFRVPTIGASVGETPGCYHQERQHAPDNITPFILLKTKRRVA